MRNASDISSHAVPVGGRRSSGGSAPFGIFKPSGFTLVELMVAVLLFGIAITAILASYRAVFSSAEIISRGIGRYDMAGVCLNRMSSDLQAMVVSLPPKYRKPAFDDSPDPYRVVGVALDPDAGDFPMLQFASLAHIPFYGADTGGIARIVYYVREEAETGMYRIKRSDVLFPTEPFEAKDSDPVVCENLKSLKITYYDAEGTAYESWDSESEEFNYSSPVSIEIQMGIAHKEDTVLFSTAVMPPVQRKALE